MPDRPIVPPPPPPPWAAQDVWQGPHLRDYIPVNASPARSYGRAMAHPLAEHPGLYNVWVRSDRPQEGSGFIAELLSGLEGTGLKNSAPGGYSVLEPGTRGEYNLSKDIITYRRSGMGRDDAAVRGTMAHELAHPVEAFEWGRRRVMTDRFINGIANNPFVYPQMGFAPMAQWLRVPDKEQGWPEDRQYEDSFAYWVSEYYSGRPVPPGVKRFIEMLGQVR